MTQGIAAITATWLLLALLVGQARLLKALPFPLIPVLILSLAGMVLLAFWLLPSFHHWVLDLDIRALILLHVTRFIGIYFLVLYGRGELPAEFAVKAGWGDILVAATALAVALLSMKGATSWYAVLVWNVFGLLDILYVITTPLRLMRQGPGAMDAFTQLTSALTQLPLSLLPTFLVPLIIASHILIFIRLAAERHS